MIMKKYLFLQTKRQFKILPAVLVVAVILFLGLGTIFLSFMDNSANSEENTKLKIALTGDTDSDYIQLGLTALQAFDDTRYSMELIELPEKEASKKLSKGEISAYIILPEHFIENALAGYIDPIKYVTTPGGGGITTMLKNEFTKIITDMVVYSEKGSYGIAELIDDQDLGVNSNKYLNRMTLEYIDLILNRSAQIEIVEMGISDGLATAEYYVCGITILLLMLIGLPYASVCIKRDNSLEKLLMARGFSPARQLLCECISHFVSLFTLTLAVFALTAILLPSIGSSAGFTLSEDLLDKLPVFCVYIIPVLVMTSVFNILFFELSDNIVSGILLHFFTTLSLCYVTGCFYPIYSFPVFIQSIAVFLPTGTAREFLSGAFTEEFSLVGMIGIVLYTLLFFGAALAIRMKKVSDNWRRKA